jgi:CshA-type fibril repeat protein
VPNCEATELTTADGSYTVNPDGAITFVPDADFTGLATVPVTYQVADEDGQVTSALLTVSVIAKPVATDDESWGAFNTSQTKDVMSNDRSQTGTPLSSSTLKLWDPVARAYVTEPVTLANGKYEIVAGQIKFTPEQNFSGKATPVTYQVMDSMGQTDTATYTPTVLAVPVYSRAPADKSQSQNVLEDGSIDGVELDIRTLKLRDPITQELLEEPSVVVPGEGAFVIEGSSIKFTPNLEELVAALVEDQSRLIQVIEGGKVIGLEVRVTPIPYQILDKQGRTVTAMYYPVVFFPTPAAEPDKSYGPADEPQSQEILDNDTATGAKLVKSTFQMVDPGTRQPTTNPSVVMPGEGTFTFTGTSIRFTPNLQALIETLTKPANRSRLVEVYQLDENDKFVLDEDGNKIVLGLEAEITPITYQIEDEFGRLVTTTYTPKLFFPSPVAAPDSSEGPADEPQKQNVHGNDAATGTKLLPETLELVAGSPRINLVSSTVADVQGEGWYKFDGEYIIFTPNLTELVKTLSDDFIKNGRNYKGPGHEGARLEVVWENGKVIGLAVDISPVTYKIQDEFGRWVETTYTPRVFFPTPIATPDETWGALNEPQRADVIKNDSEAMGIPFDNDYLEIKDPQNGEWGSEPVRTSEGLFEIETIDEATLQTAGFGGNEKIVLATSFAESGSLKQLVFTPNRDWYGTAIVEYQIQDEFGQKVQSTYTPNIETGIIPTVNKLVRTGMDQYGYLIQIAGSVALIVVGTTSVIKARRRNPSNKI